MDCIPGYSSHRISIFLVSGIFWGQCMEICGRFHHWMPIIVYFMKRDLFFLWCTHFMHYSADNNSFTTPNKDLVDYSKPVSYNKLTWSKESLNIL
jgi:heme/copper-type cytochrome/quinol oxidase subunit 2